MKRVLVSVVVSLLMAFGSVTAQADKYDCWQVLCSYFSAWKGRIFGQQQLPQQPQNPPNPVPQSAPQVVEVPANVAEVQDPPAQNLVQADEMPEPVGEDEEEVQQLRQERDGLRLQVGVLGEDIEVLGVQLAQAQSFSWIGHLSSMTALCDTALAKCKDAGL